MTKTTFFAYDPNGVRHTRSTARVYTHTVFARHSYDRELAQAMDNKGWLRTDRSNFHYYTQMASGTYTGTWANGETYTRDVSPKDMTNAQSKIGTMTEDEYVAQCRAERIAVVENRKEDGYYNRYVNLGWCGRRQLADGVISSHRQYGYVDFIVVEASK